MTDLISGRARQLMHAHQEEADQVLLEELRSAVPGHLVYWTVVVVGSFALNLLLLVVLARA